jgi:hypothetical protein
MLSEEQQFVFDLKGYVVLPGVLDTALVSRLKAQIEQLETDPESLPPAERSLPGGAFAELIDHPQVKGLLDFAIAKNPEKWRLESTFYSVRQNGDVGIGPHGGGPTLNPNYHYHAHNEKVYTGMLRVVFELNEVEYDKGGTLFMAGSHKSNFKIPKYIFDPEQREAVTSSFLFDRYACPPGSIVAFAEAVCHSGNTWSNPKHPRMAIFYAYNHVNVRHHKPSFDPAVIAGLSEERQAFFREVYHPQFDRRGV